MEIEEKKKGFREYLERQYSITSFYYLHLFGHNFGLCCDLIVLDGVTIKHLDEGKIKHIFPENELDSLKHMIVLGALSKIMVLVESFLRFSEGLSKNVRDVPKNMLKYYQPRALNASLDKIKNGRLDLDEIWKIFAFPEINCLPLTEAEKATVTEVLTHSANHIKTFYEKIASFYDEHRIAYNKFKHGLSVVVGLKPKISGYDSPAVLVMDMQNKVESLRCRYLQARNTLPDEYRWFNTLSIIAIREKTFEKYSEILADLKTLVQGIDDNHFVRGTNCGTDYMPKAIPTSKDFPEGKFREFLDIADKKIHPKTYLMPPPEFNFELEINNPLLEEFRHLLEKNNVVTLYMQPSAREEGKDNTPLA